MSSPAPMFRDPTRLTSWVRFLLHATVVISIVALVSDVMQLQLLASVPFSHADAEANDMRQRIVGIVYFVWIILSAIVFCIWVYRANVNARQLGAQGMQFTPGWSVGWYFVPIACFWKPYQAMVEIWKASKTPGAWQAEVRTAALPRWWLFWVATCIAGNIAFRVSLQARTVDALVASTWVNMVASVTTIVSALLLAGLVHEIAALQTAHAQYPAPGVGLRTAG